MEKDHFLDRPEESREYDSIPIGTEVLICSKGMQKYAEVLEDLEHIRVSEHLTSKKYHPRGQKVAGYDVATGVYKKGRVVYLVKDNCLVTKDGLRPFNQK